MKFLFSRPSPTFINFAEKPFGKYEKKPVEEINILMAKRREIIGFNWSNDYLIPSSWNLTDEDKNKLEKLMAKQIPYDENTR